VIIVDGHEDLAWNMLTFGRDYSRSAQETRRLEAGGLAPRHNGETLLGRADWVRGRIGVVFATLFATPRRRCKGDWDTQCYDDAEGAHLLYRRQLDAYHRLVENRPDEFHLLRWRGELAAHLARWEPPEAEPPVGLVVSIESAEGVRGPREVAEWFEGGVRLVGPSWAGTAYAGGTGEPGPLTPRGHELLREMADLGMGLDLSHVAEEAALQALAAYPGAVYASHSNPRALLPGSPHPDRHLSDDVLRGIIARRGVVGVVTYNRFLRGGWEEADGRASVSLARVAEHIDYICQLAGSADHAGLGSDFDGGFGLSMAPDGLDTVADLRLIGDALATRGYDPPQVAAVLGGNWLRLLAQVLPEDGSS
jgi:membrane dipeptidase